MSRVVDCSHKRAYWTEHEACRVAAHRMRQQPGLTLRVYICPGCGAHHLTSKPRRG